MGHRAGVDPVPLALVLHERVAAAAALAVVAALVGVLLVIYRPGVAGACSAAQLVHPDSCGVARGPLRSGEGGGSWAGPVAVPGQVQSPLVD